MKEIEKEISQEEFNKKFRKTYKVFIQYKPAVDRSSSIICKFILTFSCILTFNLILKYLAYVCSCKSGLKQAGCCIHVATFIYYLSYARFREYRLRLPAEYLNSVLINMTDNFPPNNPKYVRNKRLNRTHESSNEDEEESDDENHDQFIDKIDNEDTQNNDILENNQDPVESDDKKEGKKKRKRKDKNLDKPKNTLTIENEGSDNGDPKGKKKRKKKNEPDRIPDESSDENQDPLPIVVNPIDINDPLFIEFRDHIPAWSARINYKGLKNVFVSNTCSIDYYLFAMWYLNKQKATLLSEIGLYEKLENIITNIDNYNWDRARELWIVDIMKYDKKPSRNSISMFGSPDEMFLDFINEIQNHQVVQLCNEKCINNNTILLEDENNLFFKEKQKRVELHSFIRDACKSCKQKIRLEHQFTNETSLIFVESLGTITFNKIPVEISINDINFRLLGVTLRIAVKQHFIGIFDFNGHYFVIDDLNKEKLAIYLPSLEILNTTVKNPRLKRFYRFPTTISIYYRL